MRALGRWLEQEPAQHRNNLAVLVLPAPTQVNRTRAFDRSVVCSVYRVLFGLLVSLGQLLWTELDGQLVQLAGKPERHLVVVVVDRCAGVAADVEGFVKGRMNGIVCGIS